MSVIIRLVYCVAILTVKRDGLGMHVLKHAQNDTPGVRLMVLALQNLNWGACLNTEVLWFVDESRRDLPCAGTANTAVLGHNDQQGAEAAASLLAGPRQGGG